MSVWDRFFTVLSHFYRVKIFWRLWWREAMPEWSNHSFIYFSPFLIMFSHIFHCAVKVLVTLHLAPLPLLVIYAAGSYTYILYMCITVYAHTQSMSSLYNHISTYTLILLYVCMCMYVCVLFLCICVYV